MTPPRKLLKQYDSDLLQIGKLAAGSYQQFDAAHRPQLIGTTESALVSKRLDYEL